MINLPAKLDKLEFKQLKEAALDLLEQSLADISPDADHPIHIKMGIEREGHFIPPDGKENHPLISYDNWRMDREESGIKLANALYMRLSREIAELERIYHDDYGVFLAEMTTKPVSLKEAVRATERICSRMKEVACTELGLSEKDICFGTLQADFFQQMSERIRTGLIEDAELFETKGSFVMPGMGQHANVSVWSSKKNLFYQNTSHPVIGTLAGAVAAEALHTLPGMILPSRGGNFIRIENGQSFINNIGLSYDARTCQALNWRSDSHDRQRIEFRQGNTCADPIDVALAAAIPATKAALDSIKCDKDGKAILKDGIPEYDFNKTKAFHRSPMPKSQYEAMRLFNTADNPSFIYLNELADKRIAALEAKAKELNTRPREDGNLALVNQELRDARALKNIGTKLHHMYCQEYGLESKMPMLKVAQARA